MKIPKFKVYFQHEDTGIICVDYMDLNNNIDNLRSKHGSRFYIIAICLFTGLKDKNGKEIYEGDILKSLYGNCAVEFNENIASFISMNKWCYIEPIRWHKREVIGNIYQDRDLLEVKPQDAAQEQGVL